MPSVNLPLSGAVNQAFEQSIKFWGSLVSQIGLINVNVGTSTDPATERAIIADVGSYGKQLGRIGDALIVLRKHLPVDAKLAPDEERAIADLKAMLNEIANVKERHAATLVLRPTL